MRVRVQGVVRDDPTRSIRGLGKCACCRRITPHARLPYLAHSRPDIKLKQGSWSSLPTHLMSTCWGGCGRRLWGAGQALLAG